MNVGIQPPGGGGSPASTFMNNQFNNRLFMLMMQYGADPTDPQQRSMFEAMLAAMGGGTPSNMLGSLPKTTGQTTTEGQRGEGSSFMDRFGSPLQDARLEKIKSMAKGPQGGGGGGGSMPGFGGAPTTQDGPLLWDDSKQKGDGNKAISVGGNEPATNKDLQDIIKGYKSRRNAPTPPLMSPPPTTPTTPSGGGATGSAATNNYGMGNYTSASLAEMLQQLLGRRGGFGGGWRV